MILSQKADAQDEQRMKLYRRAYWLRIRIRVSRIVFGLYIILLLAYAFTLIPPS